MIRKTTAKAVGIALTGVVSVAPAEATELTDAQMDQITAGAFQVAVGSLNLLDCGGTPACSFPQNTYTFRPATSDFTDNSGAVWTPKVIYWFPNSLAFGVLTNAAGQTWDGGLTVTSGPISATPTMAIVNGVRVI
jgi:hypothetical protein